MHGIAKTA